MSLHAERSSAAVQELGMLMRSGTLTGLDEAQLLRRYAHQRDEAAFRLLVERHGPRVLGVCRRVLNDHHLADDAFQATFLVLARRATSIGRPDQLGGWLIGVARRVARKTQASESRRAIHERKAAAENPRTQTASDPDDAFELVGLLAEELERLPENHRRAIELCCIEGLSTDEAARRLGWPRGTVGTRVARGREQLKRGLERRGVSLGAALGASHVGLPRPLVHATTRAALSFSQWALGPAAMSAGAVSPAVAGLARGALRSLFMTKLSLASAALAVAVAVGGFATYRAVRARGYASSPPSSTSTLTFIDDQQAIQGTWVVTECTLDGQAPPDGREGVIGMEWTFQGDNVQSAMAFASEKVRFELGQLGQRKLLSFFDTEGRSYLALYELDGEHLRLAMGPDEKVAPSSFKATGTEGKPVLVLTLVPKAKAPKLTPAQQEKTKNAQSTARIAAARARSVTNLKQIGLAMHNYADAHDTAFPPAAICDDDGKPLLSWRVAILPYLDQEALYKQFRLNEPWDSAHNKALIAKMPKVYAPVGDVKTEHAGATFYQAFVGGGALFQTSMPRQLAKITDGISNTLLVVEANEPVTWTKPDDVAFDPNAELPKLGGTLFEDGFNAAFADGAVRFIKDSIDPKTLKALITANGGEIVQAVP
jgi:RNA polymerase sigma factor (sigma-70 family)